MKTLINFDNIEIGQTIVSDVYKRPVKCIYRTENKVYFRTTHPVASDIGLLYWYEKNNQNILLYHVAINAEIENESLVEKLKTQSTKPQFWVEGKTVKDLYLI